MNHDSEIDELQIGRSQSRRPHRSLWAAFTALAVGIGVVLVSTNADGHHQKPAQSSSTSSPKKQVADSVELAPGTGFQVGTAAGLNDANFSFHLNNPRAYAVELDLSRLTLPSGMTLISRGLPRIATIAAHQGATISLGVHVNRCANALKDDPISMVARGPSGGHVPWSGVTRWRCALRCC